MTDEASTQEGIQALLPVLGLTRLAADAFETSVPNVAMPRVFGGQVAAQALIAAGLSVDSNRSAHSLHSYFIRPGDTTQPIRFDVEVLRDGGSFSVRRVVASQGGVAIYVMSASFQLTQDGLDHQPTAPDAPDPEDVPTLQVLAEGYGGLQQLPAFMHFFDLRYVDDPPWIQRERGPRGPAPVRLWLRAHGDMPADPLLHQAALTFVSDATIASTIAGYHGLALGLDPVSSASLDHAVWFHRAFRADEWLLYQTEAPTASGSRGLGIGEFFSQDGRLVATVAQEAMIRLPSA